VNETKQKKVFMTLVQIPLDGKSNPALNFSPTFVNRMPLYLLSENLQDILKNFAETTLQLVVRYSQRLHGQVETSASAVRKYNAKHLKQTKKSKREREKERDD
jgi:hypothetical protein